MEAVVGDSVERVFVRVDGHVTLGRVEHVGHPDPPEIVHVLDGVPIAQDHSRVHPVTVDPDGSTLVPVSRSQHALENITCENFVIKLENRLFTLKRDQLRIYKVLCQAFFNIFEKTQQPKKLNDFSGQNSTNR